MTVTEPRQKDIRHVIGGRKGARKRWGPQRVLRLDGLTEDQVRSVVALVEAMREATLYFGGIAE